MSKHRTRGTRLSRLMSGLLCLALLLGLLPSTGLIQTAEAAYWADPYGEQLVEWGVMNPSSNLRLSSTITRAEFVAMCNRAFGYSKLGSTPFTDVSRYAWYAEDINIAYNAGYFQGTSDTTASPNSTLTREQAAVLVARNLMLQETVGEVQAFTDSHDLHEWSRGLIGAAVAEGMIGGYEDGSFRPTRSITRGEVAKMLVSVIGTPVNKPGDYELGGVYGNVMISSSNVTLRNTTIAGNLYVTGGVDLGNVLLENVTVLGRIVISGGGESHAGQSSVVLRNVAADELVVDSIINQFTTISAYGITDIPTTYVRSSAWLEDASWPGYGLQYIELNGDPGTKLQLAGTIKEVVNKTPFSDLQLVQGTAQKITIDEYATNSTLLIDYNTRVDELNLDVATTVTGKGDITSLVIGASGCDVGILPDKVTIRPGITATVNGEEIGSTEAAELSSEPRLLAGYPKVTNITPTQVEAQFSGNKQGIIYFAISELANGSVSVEDLVNNPAYGGNIYQNQAGTIAANSKTVYSRAITQLVPDGSYYLTAMLEDGRGNRSPIKVISFTTPDDTKPEFLNGRISRATCDVVQLTGMANKSCDLYWVLLPKGATAPTAQNFKSGSFGGNYGYGSMSVVKNVPVSIKVNTTKLQEDTDYDLYVWLNDFDGAQSSQVYHFDVHTPDETPPVIVRLSQTNFDLEDAIEFNFAINEEPSTLYWAVMEESSEKFDNLSKTALQIAVQNGTKAGFRVSGSKAAEGVNLDTLVGSADFKNALKYATYHTHNFKLYCVAVDAYNNYSEVRIITVHTKDTEPPTVKLDDTGAMDGKYPASSTLRLIFSEQVTGSTNLDVKNFVELYKDVLDNKDVGGTQLTAAKTALANELKAHIQLWYRAKSVTEKDTQLPEVDSTPVIGDGSSTNYPYGWVNWREATVVLQSNGTVILTLPAGEAVSLGSGMDYYFRFTNIYDDSYDHNRLVILDEKGNIIDGGEFDNVCELSFSTVYATVWLSKDTKGISSTNENNPSDSNAVPLDIVFDVTPESTSNMADTEFWDMVIKNTNGVSCKFVVYRSADGGNTWERVTQINTDTRTDTGGQKVDGEASIVGIEGSTSVSLNHFKSDAYIKNEGNYVGTHAEYETVKVGLDRSYKYGINFTEVRSSRTRASWTNTIKLEIRLVAGERGNLRTLAENPFTVDSNYTRLVDTEKALSEISAVKSGSETITYLAVEKQFTDNSPPKFIGNYPTLSASSSTINLEVALDRNGAVFYVVAPATGDGSIPTSIGATNITSGNDGSTADDESVTQTGTPSSDSKTYIPKGGSDIEANKEKIHFYDDGQKSEDQRKYTTPVSERILAGDYDHPDGLIKKGNIPYTGSTTSRRITGLKPETWYYVYIVLRSDSNRPDEVVQIYRVKTTAAQPPTFGLDHSGTTATIQVRDPESTSGNELYDNPDTYYAIVRKNQLPAWFSYKYDWSGTSKTPVEPSDPNYKTAAGSTVLDALINTVQNQKGKTVFDLYAENFNSPVNSTNTLKYEVLNYITRANTNDEINGTRTPYGPINSNQVSYVYKADDMKEGSEYVMLVCARHHDKLPEDIKAYGFAATQGLYMPDNVPPEYDGQTGIVEVRFTDVKNQSKVSVFKEKWQFYDGVPYFFFSGNLTLRFDKPIYVNRDGALLKVVNKATASGDEISILDVIRATGFSIATENSDGMNFALTFADIGNGDGFTMNNLCNSTGVSVAPGATAAKRLTVYFNARLTTKDVYPDEAVTDQITHIPAFQITWQVP